MGVNPSFAILSVSYVFVVNAGLGLSRQSYDKMRKYAYLLAHFEQKGREPDSMAEVRPPVYACRHSSWHSSVRLQPVAAPSAVGYEGHAEREGPLHLAYDQCLQALFLVGRNAEIEFVMHL